MARTATAGERAVIALGQDGHDVYPKLEVKDPDGNWVNLLSLNSSSWVVEFALEESIDANCQTMSATLLRDIGTGVTNSLAPLIEASLRNRDGVGAYAPFLDVTRQWRASVAVVTKGASPGGGDYKEVGAGLYDVVQVESPDHMIRLTGRDWGATLLDTWIESNKTYSPDSNESMESVIQQMLDESLGAGAITLYTPTSPSFVMNAWEQQPMSLMQAINEVAEQAGMVCRYRYDASDVNRLTLYAPDRTATPGDEVWTTGPTETWYLPTVKLDGKDIRNNILLSYWNAAAEEVQTVTAVNATSVTRYGGPHGIARTMAIDLSENTNIVTAARAQAIADAVLNDLDAPTMEQQVLLHGFWIVQLSDYGKFLANTEQYDTTQYGGVTRIQHRFTYNSMVTTLDVRGQPSGRYRTWLAREDDGLEISDLRIVDFKEKTRASTTITVQWAVQPNREGPATELWLWTVTASQPVAADPWPDVASAPTYRLTGDTTEYTFDIPDQNTILYGVLAPIGPPVSGAIVMGVPWRFTLQPTTQTKIIQRARLQSSTAQSCVVRVEVADPIPGGDVTIAYEATGLTVTPASGQTVAAANVPTTLANPGALTNYVDFTVTRPAPGANLRVIFTATSTDRTADVDAVDIPALDGIPQGVISISATGACTLTLDGAAWVASFKYAESTSAYPSDATARAGTTSNGRQVAISLSSTLAIGDSVYVTVLPYSVTGAAGVEGASVRFRATRHDFSATKTVLTTFQSLVPYNTPARVLLTNAYIGNYGFVTAGPETAILAGMLVVPAGVTLTEFAADLYDTNGGSFTSSSNLYRVATDGSRTNIAALSTSGSGWTNEVATVSETTAGRRYQVDLQFFQPGFSGPPGDGTMRGSTFSYTYSMPDSAKTI